LRYGGIFDIDNKKVEIEALKETMGASNFWGDQEKAQKTVARVKYLKGIIDPWDRAFIDCSESLELSELMMLEESPDQQSEREFEETVKSLQKIIDRIELQSLLADTFDPLNAIVSINAGAGGTEACDWAEMLLRMYERWVGKKDYSFEIIDLLQGEEAGIKNVTFMVRGEMAYGYLKAERGVHRLVRISPFDTNKRRHTSFASVDVIAEILDEIEIEINPSDLRIDTYRASGAGGQHVNKTDSAVRITHLPTNTVVQCQNERSQHKNKATAFRVLKARLYEKKQAEERAKLQKHYGDKKKIEWGSQIRSYVFHPYSMVKDHRTGEETSSVDKVMNGELDEFIASYLKMKVTL
jgi:peptide chain release factor 2